jgi:hypothetical protein
VRAVAEAGVHLISSGWITHSAPRLDVALDVVNSGEEPRGGVGSTSQPEGDLRTSPGVFDVMLR